MARHRLALATIAAAILLDVALGLAFGAVDHVGPWNGLYFGLVTATTIGYGDVLPHGWLPHLLTATMALTVVPLWSASFSLFTAGLTNTNLAAAEARIKQHVSSHHRGSGGSQ